MKLTSRLALTAYSLTTLAIAPLGALFLSYKKRRDPPYGKRIFELLGCYQGQQKLPHDQENCVWFHTVSVGEAIAARPLIKAFIACHPELYVVVTTTTTTGAQEVAKIKGAHHVFAPLDSPLAVLSFIHKFKPTHLFIMETELWPCLLHGTHNHGIKTVVFNARMPEKTCLKYLKHQALSHDLIAAPLDLVLCQTKDDQERFGRIGVVKERLKVTGSLKYDLSPNEERFAKARAIYQQWHAHGIKVLGAISTHEGEEAQVLSAFYELKQSMPALKLVLVPRHQSGTQRAQDYFHNHEGSFALKTECHDNLADLKADVLIGNTMGEIELYLGLCDLIFMGGSLVDIGGHNPLEPAFFALPIVTGRYYYNFAEQFERLIETGGAYVAQDQQTLVKVCLKLLNDSALLNHTGLQAFEVQQAGRGAIAATLRALEEML